MQMARQTDESKRRPAWVTRHRAASQQHRVHCTGETIVSDYRQLQRQAVNRARWKIIIVTESDCGQTGGSCGHSGKCHVCGQDQPADFAYTVGLHDYGLPELQMPARYEGSARAAPYAFLGQLLNAFAADCLDGDAGPGHVMETGGTVEDERARFEFRFGDPVATDVVQAFQADDEATVIPITWRVLEGN
jgi:hypothetical protein